MTVQESVGTQQMLGNFTKYPAGCPFVDEWMSKQGSILVRVVELQKGNISRFWCILQTDKGKCKKRLIHKSKYIIQLFISEVFEQ